LFTRANQFSKKTESHSYVSKLNNHFSFLERVVNNQKEIRIETVQATGRLLAFLYVRNFIKFSLSLSSEKKLYLKGLTSQVKGTQEKGFVKNIFWLGRYDCSA
jgi:hypothetical protein